MFQNYLVTALRNLVRHKLYSFINIAGLAVGLACVIFILLFIRGELSYDKWIPDTQNLYRTELAIYVPGRDPLAMAVVPFPMPAAMRDEIPEVTGMTRFHPSTMTLMVGDRQFAEHVAAVDPDFFQIIKLPLTQGDPSRVFRDPQSLVLSESAARKYFGNTDVMGKIMTTTANCEANDTACLGRMVSLKVTGVMRDIPYNTQFDGDVFFPNTSIVDRNSKKAKLSWNTENGYGYVRLTSGADPRAVIAKMAPILDRAVTGELTASGNPLKGSQAYTVHLTRFTDVHLTPERWRFSFKPPGSWTTVYGVGIVGVLILFVACFNFMNLATARAMLRAREIALRKTHGANRGQLIVQFLGEAVLMALLSLVLALALVEVLQPAFGRFLLHPIALHYAGDWPLMLIIVGITIAAGLLSGSYPALVLSGFRPATVLRANNTGQARTGRFRNALVVLQFAVSIGLGIAAAVVFTQISYARNIDLGFRKNNVLVVSGAGLLTIGGQESFVQQLRSNPDVLDVAMINILPFDSSQMTSSAQLAGHPERIELNERVIGTNAVQLLGMKLVAGRLLSDKRAQDQVDRSNGWQEPTNDGRNLLIDQAAASRLGLTPQQAVGQTIIFQKNHMRIVGVLADVKFGGAREPAKASVYLYDPKFMAAAMIRLRPDAIPQTLASIDRAWHGFAPTRAMQRHFLDDNFGKLYQADERQGKMFGAFVLVAIFIACLGLFGLAAFTVGRRTREIGIRKVFGARTRDLVILLLWQFSIPVMVANAIAWPVAWYYLHDWLQGFAYRITLSPLYFVAAGFAALVIAWATILSHALRVARANPIHALRYE
ncbi:MAG TPA: ABC transporter permease [Rhizomicrobium sp.]|nr:ABC transporter permease [Rhizomicrobium sp.]